MITLDGLRNGLGKGIALTTIAATTALGTAAPPAAAQTVIDEWTRIKVPDAPSLKPVNAEVTTTALLLLDFNGAQDPTKGPCNSKTKPRCLASLPKVAKLLAEARAKGMLVVYSLAGSGTRADIATVLAPEDGEAIVKSGPNKFMGTDLDKILAAKGIKSVIVTGTASEGAVLNTASDAAFKGMNIILPVDGMSSTELYAEQYVAWHMTHAPAVAAKTTLTTTDMISF